MTTAVRLALGLLSMAGFTASGGAAVAGVIGKNTTLVLMVISLGIYIGVLVKAEDAPRYRRNTPRPTLWSRPCNPSGGEDGIRTGV